MLETGENSGGAVENSERSIAGGTKTLLGQGWVSRRAVIKVWSTVRQQEPGNIQVYR